MSFAWADGHAGSSTLAYRLRNTGSGACSLYGYPGFAALDHNGTIIGHPATRTLPPTPARIVIQPGSAAQFEVETIDGGIDPSCPTHALNTTTIQVYPPNQTAPLRSPANISACRLQVSAVHRPAPHAG